MFIILNPAQVPRVSVAREHAMNRFQATLTLTQNSFMIMNYSVTKQPYEMCLNVLRL